MFAMSDGIDTLSFGLSLCSKEGIKKQIERVVGYRNVFGLCVGDETEQSENSSDTETSKYNRTDNMNIVFNTSEAKSQPNLIYVSM